MSTLYSPIHSGATGWIIGKIENHTAKQLTLEEVEAVCAKLNDEAAVVRAAVAWLKGERSPELAEIISRDHRSPERIVIEALERRPDF